MIRKIELKTVLAAAIIGVSAQASFAATDTSCNPFAAGSNCNGVVSIGKSFAHSFGKLAVASSVAAEESALAVVAASEEDGIEEMLSTLSALIREEVVILDEETDFDDPKLALDDAGDDVSAVPVPASAALLLAGLGGLVAMRRKKS